MLSFTRAARLASRYNAVRAFTTVPGVMDPNVPVGFIGLGNMGGHMAHNLLKKGHNLIVYDVTQPSVEVVKGYGAALSKTVAQASSPQEVAKHADVVITMLPSSPHVVEVYTGKNGIFSALSDRASKKRNPMLLIDSSTIAPPTAVEVANAAANHKDGSSLMVDAPVSGGVGGAEAGTLTFMVGGPQVNFEAARPYLQKMGKNIVHCGDYGTGQAAKVCNNLILGISMTAVSEAMNLGVKLGMNPSVLAGIINTSSGRCWSSDTYNPVPGVMPNVPSTRGYQGGFGVDLMLKDIRLALESAQKAGVELPTGSVTADLYKTISAGGNGKKDFSYVYQYLKDMAEAHAKK